MSDIITKEIDVRPAWRRWFAPHPRARPPRRREVSALARPPREGVPISVLLAAGIGCFAFGMLVSTGQDAADRRALLESQAIARARVEAEAQAALATQAEAEAIAALAAKPILPLDAPQPATSGAPSPQGAMPTGVGSGGTPTGVGSGGTPTGVGSGGTPTGVGSGETLASAAPLLQGASEIPPRRDLEGTVRLETDPPVLVFAGERRLGRTPLEVKLDEGTHELRFLDRARFLDEKREVTVTAGRKIAREFYFGIATLRVLAPQGAKIIVDRRAVGTAPIEPFEISEGRHSLRIVLGDEELISESIELPAGQTVSFRVRHQ